MTNADVDDEREVLLGTFAFLRAAILNKVKGLNDGQARWTPPDALLPLVGIVHHLTQVEWRWIDGALGGAEVSRSEEEFVASGVTLDEAVAAYRRRAETTEEAVRAAESLDVLCRGPWGDPRRNLRSVLIHLIQETARHAGHADATRELLDGSKG